MSLDLFTIADRIESILRRREESLRLEQAVYGLDSMDEVALQGMLAEGLTEEVEVAREVHYPSTAGRKLSNRPRCDLVLSPKGHPLRLDSSLPTLFDPANQTEPEEALWLEVKSAAQFRAPDVRQGRYGGQWKRGVVEDLKKMEDEPRIRSAALVLIVFVESESILQKDLDLFEELLIHQEVLAGFRQVRTLPILDRMGHKICAAAIWPTVQRLP